MNMERVTISKINPIGYVLTSSLRTIFENHVRCLRQKNVSWFQRILLRYELKDILEKTIAQPVNCSTNDSFNFLQYFVFP